MRRSERGLGAARLHVPCVATLAEVLVEYLLDDIRLHLAAGSRERPEQVQTAQRRLTSSEPTN